MSQASQPQNLGVNTVTEPRLARGVVARYSVGSLGTGGFGTLPGLVLIYYLTDSLGVAAILAGLIMTLAKVWDVLIDPIIGGLSDRALARSGSRRRPMVIGAIGLPFAFILTFAVPPGLHPWASALWVMVAFIAAATFFSLFQVPYIALPAELTGSYRERTRLLTWRVVVLTFAILLFGAGGPEIRGMFADSTVGYLAMAVVAAVLLWLGLWIASGVASRPSLLAAPSGHAPSDKRDTTRVFTLKQYREAIATLRESQPFRALLGTFILQALATGLMLAGAQFVATWVLRDERAVTYLFVALIAPALLVAPIWQKVANKVGKERGFRIASLIFMVAALMLVAMLWSPGWWVIAPVALAGAAYAGMQSLPLAMLPDVISVDRGERAGTFGGVWTAGETAGMAFGSTALTVVLTLTGYIESTAAVIVVQPASAVAGIVLAFSVLPALLMYLSLIVLGRYRLRESDVIEAQQ